MYHIGLSKRGKTMVIQAVKDVDLLDCEIYDYLGQRDVTKQYLKGKVRMELLTIMKMERPQVYGSLIHAVVE